MSKSSAKGPLLILFIGALVMLVAVFVRPMLFEQKQRKTSDASISSELIRIAGDGYLGYWFITSPEMRILAPRKGIEIDFTDDGGAYAERLSKFADEDYDCIILPVNSYIEHGAKYKFPGIIVAAISESKGADAIVGFGDLMPSGKINELNNPDLRIVYTGESPSSFLLDLTISDFDLDLLQADNSWRVEVASSEEAYKKAKKALNDRAIGDAFVMWEPEVSKAIDKLGMKYIWGSDRFAGYIIDVFVFHRDFYNKHPDAVKKFLQTYFRVLDRYASDKKRMLSEMKKSTGLKRDAVEKMVKKIDWYNLRENCSWQFGIQMSVGAPVDDGIINTIIACTDVMERAGTFDSNKLRDPYRIVNSSILEELARTSVRSVGSGSASSTVVFEPLDDSEWSLLGEVGTMRIEPITFQSGTNKLDSFSKEVVDRVALILVNNYPTYRVAIRGHTGPGDAEANMTLSFERSRVVLQRLIAVHIIDANRLHAEGLGATEKPRRRTGESERSLRLRMPRVEFVLLEGTSL
ncbi:MAG: OmpA family protein [Calditrichaeota bacterium]|nr:OmpA family protein [Calditrichota bacterium]